MRASWETHGSPDDGVFRNVRRVRYPTMNPTPITIGDGRTLPAREGVSILRLPPVPTPSGFTALPRDYVDPDLSHRAIERLQARGAAELR